MRLLFTLIIFALGVAVGYYVGSGLNVGDVLRQFEDVKKVAEKTVGFPSAAPTVAILDAVGNIPGVWQSIEDPTFTREFRVDGTVYDRYEGKPDASTEGQWHVFMSPTDEKPPFPVKEGVTYLAIKMVEEVLYFSVAKLTADELDLVYQDGGALNFKRVR